MVALPTTVRDWFTICITTTGRGSAGFSSLSRCRFSLLRPFFSILTCSCRIMVALCNLHSALCISQCADAPWLNEKKEQWSYSTVKKPSIRMAYSAKWKGFSMWSLAHRVQPMLSSIQDILEHSLDLKSSGLTLSSQIYPPKI